MLWAWTHPQGDGQGVAAQLHAYDAEHGIGDLTTPEVPFPADAAGDEDWIAQAAHVVGGVAVELTGRSPYYSALVGGGTRAVWDLARLAGWSLTWTDEAFSGATVVDASGSATFRFDEQARISGIEGSLQAHGWNERRPRAGCS